MSVAGSLKLGAFQPKSQIGATVAMELLPSIGEVEIFRRGQGIYVDSSEFSTARRIVGMGLHVAHADSPGDLSRGFVGGHRLAPDAAGLKALEGQPQDCVANLGAKPHGPHGGMDT